MFEGAPGFRLAMRPVPSRPEGFMLAPEVTRDKIGDGWYVSGTGMSTVRPVREVEAPSCPTSASSGVTAQFRFVGFSGCSFVVFNLFTVDTLKFQ